MLCEAGGKQILKPGLRLKAYVAARYHSLHTRRQTLRSLMVKRTSASRKIGEFKTVFKTAEFCNFVAQAVDCRNVSSLFNASTFAHGVGDLPSSCLASRESGSCGAKANGVCTSKKARR